MGKLENNFTWSISRDRLFTDCRRAYYYNYYLSWGGWEFAAPEITRKAYLLKNLQGIDAWIGDSVHKVIKWVLENKIAGKVITGHQARDRIKMILIEGWAQSTDKKWQENVKKNLNLFEHYYKRELSRETLHLKIKKAVDCIDNFYGLGLLEQLTGLKADNFLAIDELDGFIMDGVKVFAVPDFAVKEDKYTLYDWKTGKPSDKDIFQLSFYILYAQSKWGAPVDSVQIIPVYLNDPQVTLKSVTPCNLEEVADYAKKSMAAMRAVLPDPAVNEASIDLCPKTTNLRRCDFCRFKEICV